jgi:hypothetical protein
MAVHLLTARFLNRRRWASQHRDKQPKALPRPPSINLHASILVDPLSAPAMAAAGYKRGALGAIAPSQPRRRHLVATRSPPRSGGEEGRRKEAEKSEPPVLRRTPEPLGSPESRETTPSPSLAVDCMALRPVTTAPSRPAPPPSHRRHHGEPLSSPLRSPPCFLSVSAAGVAAAARPAENGAKPSLFRRIHKARTHVHPHEPIWGGTKPPEPGNAATGTACGARPPWPEHGHGEVVLAH